MRLTKVQLRFLGRLDFPLLILIPYLNRKLREVCSIEEVTEDTTEEVEDTGIFPDNPSPSPEVPLINNPPAKNA